MDNFERISRLKLRFESNQGQMTVEDLWDLSLTSLDTLAKKVNKQIGEEAEESFIPNKSSSKSATHNNLRLEILKHVIETKVREADDKKARTERLNTIAQLKELAAAKVGEQMSALGLEDLMKRISELEAVG